MLHSSAHLELLFSISSYTQRLFPAQLSADRLQVGCWVTWSDQGSGFFSVCLILLREVFLFPIHAWSAVWNQRQFRASLLWSPALTAALLLRWVSWFHTSCHCSIIDEINMGLVTPSGVVFCIFHGAMQLNIPSDSVSIFVRCMFAVSVWLTEIY